MRRDKGGSRAMRAASPELKRSLPHSKLPSPHSLVRSVLLAVGPQQQGCPSFSQARFGSCQKLQRSVPVKGIAQQPASRKHRHGDGPQPPPRR